MTPYFAQLWSNGEIIISTQQGLEHIVASEVRELGLPVLRTKKRTVITSGNIKDLLRLNMSLRCALNVSVPIKTFSASSYDLLYYRAKKIHWHKLFDVKNTLRIDVRGKSTNLSNSQYVVHRVKDAIMDTFRKFYDGQRPSIDKHNPDIHLIVYLRGSKVTLLLDSSGRPLFQRGYRKQHGEAPLKEDLAAALTYLMDWDEQTPLLDPFCGTGTILIEAYLRKRKIPPNLFREFSIYNWKGFDSSLVQSIRSLFLSQIKPFSGKPFIGIEKDDVTYRIAKSILKNMDIRNEIKIIHTPFEEVKNHFDGYWIVTNPPYGKRIGSGKEQRKLFSALNQFIKKNGNFGKVGILHPHLRDVMITDLQIKKAAELFNGPIATHFYVINL